jgi:hypothetical protein
VWKIPVIEVVNWYQKGQKGPSFQIVQPLQLTKKAACQADLILFVDGKTTEQTMSL